MLVKPADGRALRWPGTRRLLKTEGEDVPETGFWLLALRHGDIVEINQAGTQPPPAEGHQA